MSNIISTKTEFNYSLHGLRGLASLIVYLAHSCNGFREHMCSECAIEPVLFHFSLFGFFGVEIFFFLSGYVIFSSALRANMKSFASHRIWRLYPVFILVTLLYFILNHFIQKEPYKDSIYNLISNALFLNLFLETPALSPNAWTITYEVWFYIMTFAVLRPIVLKKHYVVLLFASIMWCFFIWKHPIALYYVMGMFTNIFLRKNIVLLFKINTKTINLIQYISLFVVICLASASEYRYHWEYMADASLWLLMAAFIIFMVTLFHQASSVARLLKCKYLMFLGTVSYTLYLVHPYSYLIARMIAQKVLVFGVPFEIATSIYITLNLMLTGLLVYVVFTFIEHKMYHFGTGKTIYTPGTSPVPFTMGNAPLTLSNSRETAP